jgi:hypothetical protein
MEAGGMTYRWVTSQWISLGEECFRRRQLSRDGSQLWRNGRSSLKGQPLSPNPGKGWLLAALYNLPALKYPFSIFNPEKKPWNCLRFENTQEINLKWYKSENNKNFTSK